MKPNAASLFARALESAFAFDELLRFDFVAVPRRAAIAYPFCLASASSISRSTSSP